jgi:Tfp pilus assembly protein PilF
MPKRPRAHVLESEARLAFRLLVQPRGWVVREVDNPDYGVDDLVEVFDESGEATGLQFYVQSRATDKPLDTALSTTIKTNQQNYFNSLGLPVLIARYHSETERTFVRWFHRFDPYPQKASQAVYFTEDDQLTRGNTGMLERELRSLRYWRSPYLEWPVEADVVSEVAPLARTICLLCYSLIEGDAYVRFHTLNSLGHTTSSQAPGRLLVRISAQSIRVEASHASHTFHTSTSDIPTEGIAALVVFGVSSVLHGLGQPIQSGLLMAFVLKTLPLNVDNTEHAGRILAAGSSIAPIRDVAEHRLTDGGEVAGLGAAIVLLAAFIEAAPLTNFDDRRIIADLLERVAHRILESDGDAAVAFSALLGSARLRFGVGDWHKANELFDAAVTDGKSSVLRADVITEVAGAAHESGDYTRAVALYTEAVELLPERTRLKLRLADSLMYAGEYTSARRQFEEYFSSNSESTYEPLWHLKYFLLRNFTDGGIPNGATNSAAAEHELSIRQPQETYEEADRRFRRAVVLDPMNARVWAEIGGFELDRGDRRRAAGPLTNAALLSRSPRTWAVAIDNAVREGLYELAEHAAAVALFDHGEELHIALHAIAGPNDKGSSTVGWVEARDAEWGKRRRGDRQ